MAIESKILKLMDRKNKLEERKDKINEQIKQIDVDIKKLEKEQESRDIEKTVVTLKGKGIDIRAVIKALENGKLDFLNTNREVTDEEEDNEASEK